jgi:ubiquinone/menaquinone biosynthesis C-methylase UbiE
MSSVDDLYREELLNILNENKVSIWVDAGGGNDPGIHRTDYDSIQNVQLVSLDEDSNSLSKNKIASILISCKLEKIPLKAQFADVITMRWVAEHVEEPKKVLKELCRILQENGRLLILTPNANHFYPPIAKHFPKAYESYRTKVCGWKSSSIHNRFYRMNRRSTLKSLFKTLYVHEEKFHYVNSHFFYSKLSFLYFFESCLIRLLMIFRIHIFDYAILGVYKKLVPVKS